jgi:hypothetical protein
VCQKNSNGSAAQREFDDAFIAATQSETARLFLPTTDRTSAQQKVGGNRSSGDQTFFQSANRPCNRTTARSKFSRRPGKRDNPCGRAAIFGQSFHKTKAARPL